MAREPEDTASRVTCSLTPMVLTMLLPKEASSQVHMQKARGSLWGGGHHRASISFILIPGHFPKVFREAVRVRPLMSQYPMGE